MLPKFKFESDFQMSKTLSQLGMANAFSSQADLSGMIGKKDLFIADILHKTFVSVDEKGTEAAAVTAVLVSGSGPHTTPIEFTVNRFFIFLIQDNQTGSILFMGRVMNPKS